ncbi:MAG: hypothetical protein M3Y18_07905 [Candidatus Eremiobacteraeota bacterium]|nr:hypothetical protein [Candidatus Eremiobacteraeota bacterium]
MANATHLRYATRWLQTALRQFVPVKDAVIAVALDDDQGAYIDNQTWPAPHFQTYITLLKSVVQRVVGHRLPTFINTYQMKVTASAPVWAWGNWYQSDAYRIGEHDRAQLEFSTALLQTQLHRPVMTSEFQAGWLQSAGEGAPRPADPSNTTLALHTMLQFGVHGVVNFPVQDTVNPSGWEAPWANWSYAWDAALSLEHVHDCDSMPLSRNPRYEPTAAFGGIARQYGALLAATHRRAPYAIVWPVSAYDPSRITNADIGQIAARTIAELGTCRTRSLTCELVDPRYADASTLRRYTNVVFPSVPLPSDAALDPTILARFPGALQSATQIDASRTERLPSNAVVLEGVDRSRAYGFLDITNWSSSSTVIGPLRVRLHSGHVVSVPALTVAARGAALVPLDLPLNVFDSHFSAADRMSSAQCLPRIERRTSGIAFFSAQPSCEVDIHIAGRVGRAILRPQRGIHVSFAGAITYIATRESPQLDGICEPSGFAFAQNVWAVPTLRRPSSAPRVFEFDALRDGGRMVFLRGSALEVGIAPDAGARGADLKARSSSNTASSIGLFRDDVLNPVPASSRDYIAKYTHDTPAGMFNRQYACSPAPELLRCTYDAPDIPGGGGRFDRTFAMAPTGELTLTERLTLHTLDEAQRLVSTSGFDAPEVGDAILHPAYGSGVAIYNPETGVVVTVTASPGVLERADVTPARRAAVLRLVLPTGRDVIVYYGVRAVRSLAQAQAEIDAAQGRRAADTNRR